MRKISNNVDRYFTDSSSFLLNFFACKDYTCSMKKELDTLNSVEINYLKIFATNPFL